MKKKTKESVLKWLKGLLAAGIGGVSNSGVAYFVKPDVFNFSDGFTDLGKMALAGGILAILNYLKKAPVPGGIK